MPGTSPMVRALSFDSLIGMNVRFWAKLLDMFIVAVN